MSQEANTDIRNLFRKFGGESSNYQEIQQTYVADKATQNWPIVEAMERSRPAVPTRKAVSKLAPAVMPESKPSMFVAQSVAPTIQPVAPTIQPVAPMFQSVAPTIQPVAVQGGLSSLFAKPVETTVAPLAAAPLRTLFGSFGVTPAAQHAAPVAMVADNSLNAVFSRLLSPQKSVAASAPASNLRGLFGFLNK
jgi:hypothetical protein